MSIEILKKAEKYARVVKQLKEIGFEPRKEFDGSFSIRLGKRALICKGVPDEATALDIATDLCQVLERAASRIEGQYKKMVLEIGEQQEVEIVSDNPLDRIGGAAIVPEENRRELSLNQAVTNIVDRATRAHSLFEDALQS
jgi:hypothetical protein